MAEVGKLYLARPHTTQNIGQTARIELKGVTSITVYGTENHYSTVTSLSDMTAACEEILEDGYYPFDTLPPFIAFDGTATLINVGGYDLTYLKDLV